MKLEELWDKIKGYQMPFKAVTIPLTRGWTFTIGVAPDLTFYKPVKGVTVFFGYSVIKNQRVTVMERMSQYTIIALCFKMVLAKLYLRGEA